MVPIPKFEWTDEMINDLFSSIGGKMHLNKASESDQEDELSNEEEEEEENLKIF